MIEIDMLHPKYDLEKELNKKEVMIKSGLASLVLSHAGTFVLGAVDGGNAAQGRSMDIEFRYVWPGGILGNVLGFSLIRSCQGERPELRDVGIYAAWGGILSPIEYVAGFGVGYVSNLINEAIFF